MHKFGLIDYIIQGTSILNSYSNSLINDVRIWTLFHYQIHYNINTSNSCNIIYIYISHHFFLSFHPLLGKNFRGCAPSQRRLKTVSFSGESHNFVLEFRNDPTCPSRETSKWSIPFREINIQDREKFRSFFSPSFSFSFSLSLVTRRKRGIVNSTWPFYAKLHTVRFQW